MSDFLIDFFELSEISSEYLRERIPEEISSDSIAHLLGFRNLLLKKWINQPLEIRLSVLKVEIQTNKRRLKGFPKHMIDSDLCVSYEFYEECLLEYYSVLVKRLSYDQAVKYYRIESGIFQTLDKSVQDICGYLKPIKEQVLGHKYLRAAIQKVNFDLIEESGISDEQKENLISEFGNLYYVLDQVMKQDIKTLIYDYKKAMGNPKGKGLNTIISGFEEQLILLNNIQYKSDMNFEFAHVLNRLKRCQVIGSLEFLGFVIAFHEGILSYLKEEYELILEHFKNIPPKNIRDGGRDKDNQSLIQDSKQKSRIVDYCSRELKDSTHSEFVLFVVAMEEIKVFQCLKAPNLQRELESIFKRTVTSSYVNRELRKYRINKGANQIAENIYKKEKQLQKGKFTDYLKGCTGN